MSSSNPPRCETRSGAPHESASMAASGALSYDNEGTAEESLDRRLHESTRRNRAIDPTHPFPSSTDAPELRRSPGGQAASEASGRLARIAAELEQVTAGAADPVVVGGVERLPSGFLRQHPQAQEGDVVEMHDVRLGLRDEFLVGPVHALRLPR